MVTDEFCHTRLQGGDLTKRRWQEGWGGGGGDYLRKAIIVNISVLGGDYSR